MKQVVASWSGGIDSTGVLANLLVAGFNVKAITLQMYGGKFGERERKARNQLFPILSKIAERNGGLLNHIEKNADWIWAFSPDEVEIPRRNKHIIDHLVASELIPNKINNIAMGEYVGADSWLIKDHVGAADADHRSLSAYLYYEWGIQYRLISLQDFGESRYKSDRVRIGWNVLGPAMFLTSNCLMDSEVHCGRCYKCLERQVAFQTLGIADKTVYQTRLNKDDPVFQLYLRQMIGEQVDMSAKGMNMQGLAMPRKA